jgi:hypothetical protein
MFHQIEVMSIAAMVVTLNPTTLQHYNLAGFSQV